MAKDWWHMRPISKPIISAKNGSPQAKEQDSEH